MTAAIYTARANFSPLVLHGDQPGGQLTTTNEVENFPGFPEGILGQTLLDNMAAQAERFGAEITYGAVRSVDFSTSPKSLVLDDGSTVLAKTVIISTGAKSRMLGIPNEMKYFAKGVSTCATCDGFFFKDKIVAVVGGGDSACEEANFLTRHASKVYQIVRKRQLRASAIMAKRVEANPKVEIIYGAAPTEFVGDGTKLSSVKMNMDDGSTRELPLNGCFIAIGHLPNSSVFKDYVALDHEGFIVRADGWSTATNVPGVFACGDVADVRYKQAITAAGTGCMAALEAQKYLEGLE
jgi:thioredoxin reductase (NADPH)